MPNPTKNPMNDNMLACYPYVLKHLRQLDGITKVKEVHDIDDLQNGRKALPLDNAVYVIFDGHRPDDNAGKGRYALEELSFSIVLTKRHYTPSNNAYTPNGVGETLTTIIKHLQGFDPVDENGNNLTVKPFIRTPALPLRYREGFAFFPLRFTTQVAIGANK